MKRLTFLIPGILLLASLNLQAAQFPVGFWKKLPLAVSITDQTITDVGLSADARYRLDSSGIARSYDANGTGGYQDISGQWLTAGVPADAECRATITSGSLTSGTTGSWMALTTSREWRVVKTTSGTLSCTMTIEIRRASDGTVLDTITVTITAQWSNA